MTTPEADPADLVEQTASAARDNASPAAADVPVEAPEGDVLEQSAPAGPGEHVAARDLPLESDEADAAEQAVVVELDEDDYR
jgi:hypothetical protein